MKRFILLFVCTAFGSVGCANPSLSDRPVYESGSPMQPIAEEMPDDFGFSISYGIGKKNEVNTFTETVTKDLIEDGTITAPITLTEDEKAEIYEKMKEMKMTRPKHVIPEPVNGSTCEQRPFEEDHWEITMNGETFTHTVSGVHCEPTQDAEQLLALRSFVVSKISGKEEYLELPDATGGYD